MQVIKRNELLGR